MILQPSTKEIIKTYINTFVPEGINPVFHIDCRKHMFDIIEIFIEKDIIKDLNTIKHYCINWEEMLITKYSLLN
jgi:hypothetical protein